MALNFLRSLRRSHEASQALVASRLARVAPAKPHSATSAASPPSDGAFESGTRPLYDSSVYHSRLEELPTFAATFLNEAAAEEVTRLLDGSNAPESTKS
jgi:hypothetical protein